MARYWLTPLTTEAPVTIKAERVQLSQEEGDALRSLLSAHPRLLPSFKLALFTGGEDTGGACTPEEGSVLPLDQSGDLTLTGRLTPSHCAVAFMDRLLLPEEALALVEKQLSIAERGQAHRLETLLSWWREGSRIMLLKEEG